MEGEPPCDDCPAFPVDLRQDNEDAAKIYNTCRRQVITFFNGEVDKEFDLNQLAVWALIDHYPKRLKDPWAVFEKIIRTYHHFLKERNEADK